MAAAEYYGYDPERERHANGRQREDHSNRPGYGNSNSSSNNPTGLHLPYDNSPYNSSSQDVLGTYPPSPLSGGSGSGAVGAGAHNLDHYPTHPERDSISSIAGNSKPYSDPYAENIPLRPTAATAGGGSGHSPGYTPPLSTAHAPAPLFPPPTSPKHKRGLFAKAGRRKPWFCWILATIQIAVFIAEIARNATLTGSPIAIKPSFNPMLGPSPYVLINMGGRYVLCMKRLPQVWDDAPAGGINFPCPSTTKNDAECTLAQHCGFSGIPTQEELLRKENPKSPNQWFRFITPIFLHAGLIHIGFNMLLQLRLGADMERDIGSLRFAVVYFLSGIFGFILGGNYAPSLVVSTGASGCLFGVLALVLLDLFYTWRERRRPWKDFAYLGVDIVISFVLGLLPGLDNFAHIGGFVMGLMLGLTVLHSPDALRRKIGGGGGAGFGMRGGLASGGEHGGEAGGAGATGQHVQMAGPYSPVGGGAGKERSGNAGGADHHHHHHQPGMNAADIAVFVKDPVGFFRGRKPLWWVWWVVRAGMLACAVVATSVLLKGFYVKEVECGWCKYLSCLPVLDWCELGNLPNLNGTAT